jgi:hypothetical protein
MNHFVVSYSFPHFASLRPFGFAQDMLCASHGLFDLFLNSEFHILLASVTAAISSLMLLRLKIQGSRRVDAEDLAPLFVREIQRFDLSHGFEITHSHRIIRSQYHAVCSDNLNQIM